MFNLNICSTSNLAVFALAFNVSHFAVGHCVSLARSPNWSAFFLSLSLSLPLPFVLSVCVPVCWTPSKHIFTYAGPLVGRSMCTPLDFTAEWHHIFSSLGSTKRDYMCGDRLEKRSQFSFNRNVLGARQKNLASRQLASLENSSV